MSTRSNGRSYVVCSRSVPDSVCSTSTGMSPNTFGTSGSATTSTSPSTRTTAYVTAGCTATAVFEISVHGVVVQTSSAALRSASGPLVTGNRTNTDGSVTS